jgi:hypothetical protein
LLFAYLTSVLNLSIFLKYRREAGEAGEAGEAREKKNK